MKIIGLPVESSGQIRVAETVVTLFERSHRLPRDDHGRALRREERGGVINYPTVDFIAASIGENPRPSV